jgi:hypothetical protein
MWDNGRMAGVGQFLIKLNGSELSVGRTCHPIHSGGREDGELVGYMGKPYVKKKLNNNHTPKHSSQKSKIYICTKCIQTFTVASFVITKNWKQTVSLNWWMVK